MAQNYKNQVCLQYIHRIAFNGVLRPFRALQTML